MTDNLEAEVKTLAINLESYKRDSDKCSEDMQIHLNDVSEQLYTIQNNHLAHIKADIEGNTKDIKWLKWVIGAGLAALAILIGIPTIIALVLQLRQV